MPADKGDGRNVFGIDGGKQRFLFPIQHHAEPRPQQKPAESRKQGEIIPLGYSCFQFVLRLKEQPAQQIAVIKMLEELISRHKSEHDEYRRAGEKQVFRPIRAAAPVDLLQPGKRERTDCQHVNDVETDRINALDADEGK